MGGCLTLLFFSGGQAVIMGWYCLARGGQDGVALMEAAVACKAVRIVSDVLMGSAILRVPSLMENMAKRAVEIWAEGLLRPLAERVRVHPRLVGMAPGTGRAGGERLRGS